MLEEMVRYDNEIRERMNIIKDAHKKYKNCEGAKYTYEQHYMGTVIEFYRTTRNLDKLEESLQWYSKYLDFSK